MSLETWQRSVAMIRVDLKRDLHHADCDHAKAGGPDATLACAKCGGALWMHATRHDTCGWFCWVTEMTLTMQQIGLLATTAGLPDEIRVACGLALNDYALAAGLLRDARRTCATAINRAKHEARKPFVCHVEHDHWEGPMICGNTLPCPTHGDR